MSKSTFTILETWQELGNALYHGERVEVCEGRRWKTIQESNGSFGYILAKLEERYIRVHAIPRSVTIRIFTDDEGGPVDVEFVEGEPGYPGDRAKRTLAGYDYEITLK